MKTCSKCKKLKDLTCFNKDKSRKDGLNPYCKLCRKKLCSAWLDKNQNYHKNWAANNKDKVNNYSKEKYKRNPEKHIKYSKSWRSRNPDKVRITKDMWRKSNPIKWASYSKKWRDKNPERSKEITQVWRDKNKDKCSTISAKRRANKLKAVPSWLTKTQKEEIRLKYKIRDIMSVFQREEYHVDHIVPLQGENVCGLHVPWNLQIIPAKENLSKNNKHDDWST